MQTEHESNPLLLLATATLAVLIHSIAETSCAARANAQTALTDDVALARLCISEAGWECTQTGDGLSIHEVISRAAQRGQMRYTTAARNYARRLFGAREHDVARLRWVGELTAACTEPAHWPTTITVRGRVVPHAPWASFRDRCRAVFAWAAETVRTHPSTDVDSWSICERPVHDWGGYMDRANAASQGLVPVLCVLPDEPCDEDERQRPHGANTCGTRNDFYCRPSVDPTCVNADRD